MPAAPPAGWGRRRLLGYAASAAAGAAVGAPVATVLSGDGDRRAAAAPVSSTLPAGGLVSPYGPHQPGVAQATPHVGELVALDLLADVDRDALGRLLRLWTGDVQALTEGRAAPGDTAPELAAARAELTVTIGLGPGVFTRPGLARLRPGGLTRVPPMRHDRLRPAWSGGDLVLLVAGADATTVAHAVRRLVADAAPFARLRWRQVGSWNGVDADGRPATGRNLFGQVDGSGNPRAGTDLFDRTVWIADGAWAGGTTLVVRRIRMNLDTWDHLTRDEQERTVGRRLGDGGPLTGGGELSALDLAAREEGRWVIPLDAHARRSHPSTNGGARILRKGLNYTREVEADGGVAIESGLVFCSFQADVARQFTPLQRSLDESDALNEWTTAIGSAEFAVLPGFEPGGWLGEQVLG